jgi:ligand-binding SRPBCC domain-containing protein
VARTVRVETGLEAPAERVWETLKNADTLRYVTRGVLGFKAVGPIPDRLHEGDVIRLKLRLFNVLPAGPHEIRILRVDDERRRIETNETGRLAETWNHVIAVDADGAGRTRYSDAIEIGAGAITPLVAGFAELFFRYRQRRWRKLAKTL